ncbi:MAG: Holliday junction resolvase RuvX [Candidatus Saccharimonadales bacterium]|nr:Holliday junction resolvase RuvX [Candidatus Saccharimonadales bacterium]
MQNLPFNNALALDLGEARIGVARGSSMAKIAEGLTTLLVDGNEVEQLKKLVEEHDIDLLVVGIPRNQAGEPTEQTKKVFTRAEELADELQLPLQYQDESLTSVAAEKLLNQRGERYDKGDVDRVAAEIIMQDFLDRIR